MIHNILRYAVWVAMAVGLTVIPPERWYLLLLGELIVIGLLVMELLVYAVGILRTISSRVRKDAAREGGSGS